MRRRFRQPGHCHRPLRRQLESHFMRTAETLRHGYKCRSSVKHRERTIYPVRPDRHFTAIDAIGEQYLGCSFGLNLPAILPRFPELEPLAVRAGGRNGFDVPSVLADEIRTRGPDRQENLDVGLAFGRQHGFDKRIVRRRFREADCVPNRWMKPCGLVVFNHTWNGL